MGIYGIPSGSSRFFYAKPTVSKPVRFTSAEEDVEDSIRNFERMAELFTYIRRTFGMEPTFSNKTESLPQHAREVFGEALVFHFVFKLGHGRGEEALASTRSIPDEFMENGLGTFMLFANRDEIQEFINAQLVKASLEIAIEARERPSHPQPRFWRSES